MVLLLPVNRLTLAWHFICYCCLKSRQLVFTSLKLKIICVRFERWIWGNRSTQERNPHVRTDAKLIRYIFFVSFPRTLQLFSAKLRLFSPFPCCREWHLHAKLTGKTAYNSLSADEDSKALLRTCTLSSHCNDNVLCDQSSARRCGCSVTGTESSQYIPWEMPPYASW